jgi:uncharacterized secreted repeat protein (TIGR03808 family)
MTVSRRHFLAAAATGTSAFAPGVALSGPLSRYGLDAASLGVRASSPDDQTRSLQRAADRAASSRVPLVLEPGVYRVRKLKLRTGTSIVGVRGATRLLLTGERPLITVEAADDVSLTGIEFDGSGVLLPRNTGLLTMVEARSFRLADCVVVRAGGNGILLDRCNGSVASCVIADSAEVALFSRDGTDLTVAGNVIQRSGNAGIQIWQSENRSDGSKVYDNTIEDTLANAGGNGQNGNAINVFRAGNVIVRGNHIRRAAFSAVRGNAASNIQIIGNNCSALGEVALYSEFGFQGAVIADNIVDVAAFGISVTNFNDGGRLATVRGNLIRNIASQSPSSADNEGIGISVEADTAVSGSVVENAANIGIKAGWGTYLRNVALTGNVVRMSGLGFGVSVTSGAGGATISGNVISRAKRGAIVGMNFHAVATGDLAVSGADRYPQLKITGNQVS